MSVSQGEYARAKDAATKAKQIKLYRIMDSDGSGKVSAMEYRRYLHRMIDIADTDRDGEVARRDLNVDKH